MPHEIFYIFKVSLVKRLGKHSKVSKYENMHLKWEFQQHKRMVESDIQRDFKLKFQSFFNCF